MKKQLAAAAAFAAIAFPVTASATASAAPAGPATVPYPCGSHWTANSVWYNHCGPTNILVYVDKVFGDDYVYCLPPGNTYLGPAGSISDAWYYGGAGCSPVIKP